MCCYVEYELFWDIGIFLSPPSAVFLLLSVAGHAGGPSERWGQVCALTKVRGTCSGGSKSRTLANNHGIAFRPARANQAHANPEKQRSICATRNFYLFFAKKLDFHHT